MPGMFSRRRGSSAQPPANRSTISAATVAASQAYIKTSQSAALSSAAAAAALRSHTTTPEPVGSLQTKRMIRRGSVSSVTSGNGAGNPADGRPGLQRSNSSSSMTERTFRTSSQSPSRNGARSPPVTHPPVPPLPKTLRNGPPRRASSTEPPARVMSPTPANGKRSMSVDKPAAFPKTLRSSGRLANVPELDTSRSQRASVNFSRPRVGSPEPSPVTAAPIQRSGSKSGGWFAGPTGTASTSASAIATAAAPAPKKTAPPPIQPNATPAQEMEEIMVYDPNSRKFVKTSRPKPAQGPPPSPIVDNAPALKPGEYNPATRSIVPMPRTAQPDDSADVATATKKSNNQGELSPPPRNPARLSPDSSPVLSARPPGLLHKQPSVVREDPDAERAAEADTPSAAKRPVTSHQMQAAPKSYVSTASHQRSTSLDVPRGVGDRNRGGSLSPSRSTRFSATPVVEGGLHEPHRGISPAKSALKHSPSSSIRTASPVATFSPTTAAQSTTGDISDSTSLASADGASAKKKKSVRVSFDNDPPVPPIPTAKPTASRTTEIISDDDQDEVMQPRPALPSFGSVRRNNRVQSDVAEKVTESSPDRGRITPEQAPVAPSKVNDPLPPDVTSKDAPPVWEASDDVPVATTVTSTALNEDVPAINLHPPTPGAESFVQPESSPDEDAQHMSESQELSALASDIIFYGEESDDSRARRLDNPRPAQPARKDSDADVYSDAPESQDDAAGFASLDAIVESPLASPVRAAAPATGPLTAIPESPTRVKAAGDASGSPTSPTGDWTATTAYWSNLTKEKRAQQEREHLSSDDEAKPKRSFFKRNKKTKEGEASPVSTPVKTAPPPVVTAPSTAAVVTAPASPKASTAPARPVQSVAPPVQRTKSPPPAASSQPLKPALKKTVRAPAPAEGEIHIPRTMRGAGASTKAARPQSALVTTSSDNAVPRVRPASVSSPVSGPKAPRDAAPIAASSLTANKLGKKFQDDSDSESSFKKKHRLSSSIDSSGKYNMRRSMRAGSVESSSRVASPPPASRSSLLRSLSPSSVTSGRGESLRQSLRGGPPDAGARTLRGNRPTSSSKPRPASSGMASRFKSRFVDSDDEDDAPRGAAKPAYRSRFADSDEEDDFTIPEELTPVRGIPRRKGQEDGDSTDLDDESDGGRRRSPSKKKNVNAIVADPAAVEKAMEAARRKLGIAEPGAQPSNEGGALKQGTMRDRDNDKVLLPDMMSDNGSVAGAAGTKKRGFLGSLLKRNRSSSRAVPQVDSPAPPLPTTASPRIDTNATPQSASKQYDQTPTSPSSPSAAKLVRRSSHQPPQLQRGNSGLSTATAPAGPSRDEHWPLPPPIPTSRMDSFKGREDQRPQTSDEALQSTRPAERPQNRRSFSARVGFTDEAIAHSERDESVVGANADGAYSQRTGKKKRFGLLRRAFGLYD